MLSNPGRGSVEPPWRFPGPHGKTKEEHEVNTSETRAEYECIPHAPRMQAAYTPHTGGFDVTLIWPGGWLRVALLVASAFLILHSAFAPVWLLAALLGRSAF